MYVLFRQVQKSQQVEPDVELYSGLRKMLPAWKQVLEAMPPMMANYIIDQFEAEKLFP